MAKRFRKKKLSRWNENRHAAVAVDPGGTSGLFASEFIPGNSMKETCWALDKKSIEIHQCKGDFREQSKLISEWIKNYFALKIIDGIRIQNHHVIIEDWDTHRKSPGREIISAWIASGVDCLLTEGLNPPITSKNITYFYATQAKRYATNDRLKLWKLYTLTTGKPHARDASRHWATRVNQIIK